MFLTELEQLVDYLVVTMRNSRPNSFTCNKVSYGQNHSGKAWNERKTGSSDSWFVSIGNKQIYKEKSWKYNNNRERT